MHVNKDFEELLHHFNAEGVDYLLVGAYAVIYYTEPRYTKDIDLWVNPKHDNAERVAHALKLFGAPLRNLTLNDLMNPDMVYQIGIEPNRIDILMGIEGLVFDKAWKKRHRDYYGKEKVSIVSLEDLIRAKRAANRKQDQTDLQVLEAVLKQKKKRRGSAKPKKR